MNDRVVYWWDGRMLNETISAIVPMIGDIVDLPVTEKNSFGQKPTYSFRAIKRSFSPRPIIRGEAGNGTTVFIEVIRMEEEE